MYVLLLLIVRKHHGDTVPKGKILHRDIKPVAAFVGPGRANARPVFLTGLVFARGLAMVEDIAWSVWHRNVVSATAFSVGDWQEVSMRGDDIEREQQTQKKYVPFSVHGMFCIPYLPVNDTSLNFHYSDIFSLDTCAAEAYDAAYSPQCKNSF